MKQYDKIFSVVPDSENGGKYAVVESKPIRLREHVGTIICLSMEELREMWEECRNETWQDARPTTKYEQPDRLPGFEGYLTSKGINI